MKIKVVNIKDLVKYLSKFILAFGIIAILVNFFYSKKYITSCFSINSSKLISILDSEIVLFKKNNRSDILNIFLESNKNFNKETINNEFNMIRMVATQNLESVNIWENNENVSQNINQEDKNKQDNQNVNQNNNENINNIGLQEAQTGVAIEVMPSNVSNKYTHEIFGVQLKNESEYNLSVEITDLNLEYNKNDIMIFHTHTCESYTSTEQYQYEASGTFRTTDLNYSVARVGDELEKYLCKYGYNVVHDKSYHDYPAYNGSYDRSLITVKNLLSTYRSTDVVIDLHRDAIGDNTYAPKVKIGDEYCARLMLVIGTDGGGLSHKNWRENLKFAIKLQQKANELYPGLFKPIIVRNSRYNHHVSNSACIIEVGATGNTLEECLNSMKYLGKIYDEM